MTIFITTEENYILTIQKINIIFHFNNKISLIKTSFLFILIVSMYLLNNKQFALFNLKYMMNYNIIKKKYNDKTTIHSHPFLSIIIPIYNVKTKYLLRAFISILNQTFNNFEIIVINDFSSEDTKNTIMQLFLEIKNVKIIHHNKNLGIYNSRVDGILNANGKYILFMDSDDMISNQDLFKIIYFFNLEYNLDIIEFVVLYENEGKHNILKPDDHRLSHYHNHKKKIIYQPELSNILFFEPKNNSYTTIICRPIWNKIVRKEIFINTINFIGTNIYFNLAEDTIMNVLNFQFASNYSNINVSGYIYNIRKKSITHGNMGKDHEITNCKSVLIYLKSLYKYIKYFKKNRNYLFYELKEMEYFFLKIKNYQLSYLLLDTKKYFNDILNDVNVSYNLKNLVINFSMQYTK